MAHLFDLILYRGIFGSVCHAISFLLRLEIMDMYINMESNLGRKSVECGESFLSTFFSKGVYMQMWQMWQQK